MDLSKVLSLDDVHKVRKLGNPKVEQLILTYAQICQPKSVKIISDSPEDINYIRDRALYEGEEITLNMAGHTIHYDGYYDQGRDKEHTRVLVSNGENLGAHINTKDRQEGLDEIFGFLENAMTGKEMLVRFFCLGPLNSRFSIPAMQITDSAYVAHSEDLLYRSGYGQFCHMEEKDTFFYFIHSTGELDEKQASKNIEKRRVYIDLQEKRVISVNNQYAGNSIGLKKLALRLAIHQANQEKWLTEHMFIMGVRPDHHHRTTYFCGAFPSACGKTSTAMIPGQTIIGDDIAYLRHWRDGYCHAVNIESGIFGIIKDVNPKDDPVIYHCLTTPRELIFSNVLTAGGSPYWLGMGKQTPDCGINHAGKWCEGQTDDAGKSVSLSHKNARYTLRLSELDNLDPNSENPKGVPIHGIIYGGRDCDTNPPVIQSLNWNHGVMMGASLESETTSATLGEEGKRSHSPMANLDFVVVPLQRYIRNHFEFGKTLKHPPVVFGTNYFLKDEKGNFLNDKTDKKVWMLWAEGRIHQEFDALLTPIGYIPYYHDLDKLFQVYMNKKYSICDYEFQFSIRITKLLEKLDRIEQYFEDDKLPKVFYEQVNGQRQRLYQFREKYKEDVVSPLEL